MKIVASNLEDLKKLSIWIISVYAIANILSFVTGVYLDGIVNEWLYDNIKLFLGILLIGLVIMSLINSVQIIRKTNVKKNIKWIIISAIPFIFFLIGLSIVITVGELSKLRF